MTPVVQAPRPLHEIYRTPLALLTDLYQLTMAYAHWKAGTAAKEGVFHLFFRQNPFAGGYSMACGLTHIIDFVNAFHYEPCDLDFLATLRGNDGNPLFDDSFLHYLSSMRFEGDVDAVPEGSVVFPFEPMVRVRGPMIQGTLLETPLLTLARFPSLIATKASRIKFAANGEPVLDFGLRRAQGIDGALPASWACYVGGVDATSNVLASKLFGIPCKGTHAHSWVMSFEDECAAFMEYAKAMPNNCVFLVDTFSTLEGIQHAIEVGQWLRRKGFDMVGVRLDSGDLAYLSQQGRKMLDRAGFSQTQIFASNDLDENLISSLKQQGAKINVWGIGTKLITAFDQPAMGCVYKLAAWRQPGGNWHYPIKLSEQLIKISTPGIQQIRRFYRRGKCAWDMIYNELEPPSGRAVTIDPLDATRRRRSGAGTPYQDLLIPVFRNGSCVYATPDLESIRAYAREQLRMLHPTIKRHLNPHAYPVGLESGLHQLKTDLILQARTSQQHVGRA
ncbi:MAG: nicotinate phosphoribosyltransferase [Candidatus Entotheonella gemina]|uniref:Nicotinate phosphoribosyltransferase n=1 Tax=Candidatus Entotheonella gemina TaxID=1429439 RepID=W4MDV5_9BACT|nr:MAG: nicotinate phosphoribosyltransferase [Candidatus Entotheonella gemina]